MIDPWPSAVTLGRVSRGGVDLRFEPDDEALKEIAKILGLVAVESMTAEVFLRPWMDGAEVSGLIRARVTQVCSVSADEFEEPIESRFSVHVLPADSEYAPQDEDSGGELGLDPDGDDPPDVLEGETIDVSGYVIEHLALELDPFPRKPGAVFEPPPEPVDLSPFAALKALKTDPEAGGDGA
uniref:DNA-binding protein n=1 Tax=Caulobacter sp. (strain K31) TaxID=366602 RepID=B0T0T3_CAUSK